MDAPDGHDALNKPSVVVMSTSTVGLPRESMIWRPWTAVIDDAWRVAVRLNNVFVECCSIVWLACNVMLECSETACAPVQLGVSAARLRDTKP